MIKIMTMTGLEARELVNPFYAKYGSQGEARETDLFFLAFRRESLVGSVRYCVEEQTHLLRTMLVAEPERSRGIARSLLTTFAEYLQEKNIRPVYCLPYSHLKDFYAQVGFNVILPEQTPGFLLKRLADYKAAGRSCLCMMRE
jgi:N-acetylglutamate synthase-like GNAT family acetyltransferase